VQNQGRKNLPARTSALSIEELAIRSGIPFEHVLLEGENVLEPEVRRVQTVRRRLVLRNPVRRAHAAFVLFDDGTLSVREQRRGKPQPELTIDLRYLDSRPMVMRRLARRSLGAALLVTSLGLLAGLLAYWRILPFVLGPVAAGCTLAAFVLFYLFVRRRQDRIAFRTLHGRATVLTMVSNFGCFRAYRALTRELAGAIRETRRRNDTEKHHLLRGEIREHYRLTETGVLPVDVCTAAIRRTLAHFD